MQKIQVVDLNTGEIIHEETHRELDRLLERYAYQCYVATKDERVELYINDIRVSSYNYGGAL